MVYTPTLDEIELSCQDDDDLKVELKDLQIVSDPMFCPDYNAIHGLRMYLRKKNSILTKHFPLFPDAYEIENSQIEEIWPKLLDISSNKLVIAVISKIRSLFSDEL